MPRTRSLAWSELKIGVLAVLALTLSAVMIFVVGGAGGFPWQRYELRTRFPNVQGLKEGAVVRLAGVEIGTVSRIEFVGAEVEVALEVSREQRERIRAGSRATIGSLSLLGEPVIDLTASTEGEPIPDGGYVQSARTPGQLADLSETATRGLGQATRLLEDIRAGRGTIGKLFTDDQLYQEINGFVAAAQNVADNIRRGRGTLGALVTDRAAYRALEGSLRNLDALTARINAGEGSLGRLLKDDAFARSLSSTTERLDTLTGRLNAGQGTAGKLLTDDTLFNRLNSFSERLDQLLASLNQGQGTAGQLLRDRQLYENMNGAVTELRSLVSDIRKDPKRYLNVRVSIF
jgi:phospholipid/cholesterol/gamma-HCH transport system substrate-binding protein